MLALLLGVLLSPLPLRGAAGAAPGLCVGPVCADQITRSAQHHWQLRLRVADQSGQRERLVVDCRSLRISPEAGAVDRLYATALARRVCRLVEDTGAEIASSARPGLSAA
ncbi:hypothetical protein KBY90_03875 [Cyanobium sp. CH-040]|nr:hypothetical protein [Cyanobium sp. CH-040]